MKRLILASHGPLAAGLKESASLIAGDQLTSEISCLSIELYTSKSDVEKEINEIFKHYDLDDEILVLTDVYGGSITKYITEYVNTRKIHIITGVNLSMLLEAIFFLKNDGKIEDKVFELQKIGKDGIKYINDCLNEEGDEI